VFSGLQVTVIVVVFAVDCQATQTFGEPPAGGSTGKQNCPAFVTSAAPAKAVAVMDLILLLFCTQAVVFNDVCCGRFRKE
jgi:hypothetical protein